MDVTVEVHCSQCGSANYSLPDGAGPESRMTCNDCGRKMGTLGALQEEVMARIFAQEAGALRRNIDLD